MKGRNTRLDVPVPPGKKRFFARLLSPEVSCVNVNREEVEEELRKVLSSPRFMHNQRQSAFLSFVVQSQLEGSAWQLKETVIGNEVMGRKPDYDPKLDPIVRTEAMRLRARLAGYYAGEGAADSIVINIPKGSYVPAIRRNHVKTRDASGASAKQWVLAGGRLAVAAGLIVLAGIGWLWLSPSAPKLPVIVVLPFENLRAEPDIEFLADSLTHEITQKLSVIDGLEVKSRTSSFAFKGKARNLRDLGRQMGVNLALEGSVSHAGGQIRIIVQLVHVDREVPLWSGRFDRKLKDILIVQDEVSRMIVDAARLTVGGGQRRYHTQVDLYLRARTLLDERAPMAAEASRKQFHEVIGKDPAFAPAYAGIAETYGVAIARDPLSEEAYSEMRQAAAKALELDPLLPEAHAAMGLVHAYEGDWRAAERDFRQAIRLNPGYSRAYAHLAWGVHVPTRRVNEALKVLSEGLRANPGSLDILRVIPWVEFIAGRYDDAITNFRTVLAMEPHSSVMKQGLARALIQKGQVLPAITLLEGEQTDAGYLGYAYAVTGRRAEAELLAARNRHRPRSLVYIYAGLGDRDQLFEALQFMTEKRDPRVAVFAISPELAFVRDDPRMAVFRKHFP